MGKIDTCTKDYVKDNTIFADIFNHFLYQGEQKIVPEALFAVDTTKISVPYGVDRAGVPIQKYRDHLEILTAKTDQSAVYLLLGIENQGEVHYAMPVKCMVYDALDYASQVEKVAKSHREEKQKEKNKKEAKSGKLRTEDEHKRDVKITSGEYLTGFYKEDYLIPVITLVIYFGANEWDGPRNLHQMFAIQDKKILSYIPNYEINLLAPQEMKDEEIAQFQTDFREVMLFCKYMKDKEKLSELLNKNPAYRNMDQKAIRVIEAVANTKIQVNEKEEKGNVCEGLQGIIDDAIQEEKKKVEEEKKKAVKEKRKADKERKRAEEERKRADLAEERLRKEKTKMTLLLQLSKDGRNDDIGRISMDEEYCQQLMKEYGMM